MEEDTKACPVCGETIKAIALKCRFCNTDLATYTATKEADTEKTIFDGRPAVIYNVNQFIPFLVVVILAGVAIYLLETQYEGAYRSYIGYVILAAVLACSAILFRYWTHSRATHYIITSQRIKLERGMLSKVQEALELFRVDHFELRRPLGSRLLGHASLHLYSSDAELENFYIYGIPNLAALADQLREYQLRERDRRRLTTFVKA